MSEPGRRACLHCTVTGRVQGVGFRAFTAARAREFGLVGWVRNLENGRSVEVWAEGNDVSLDRLRLELASGPGGSRVDELACSVCEPTGGFRDFDVQR